MKNVPIFLAIIAGIALSSCSPQFATHYVSIPKGELDDFLSYRQKKTIPLVSAHRGGGEYTGFPENAIQSFEYILRYTPAIIECDVAMTKDSVLILMHDNTLDRTTTCAGSVGENTWADIQTCYLEDNKGRETPFKVPLYKDVLIWAKGKAVITVDVKRGVPYEWIIRYIQDAKAQDYAAVITYNLQDARKVYDLDSNLMISVSIRDEEELQKILDAGIPPKNIIAFTGTREPSPKLNRKLHELNILAIFGTLGGLDKKAAAVSKKKSKEMYRQCIEDGADILATDRPIEASKAIRKLIPRQSEQMRYFNSKINKK